jgi:hypothetical protein
VKKKLRNTEYFFGRLLRACFQVMVVVAEGRLLAAILFFL